MIAPFLSTLSLLVFHVVLCVLFWFKRQGVPTLSCCGHTDGVLSLSRSGILEDSQRWLLVSSNALFSLSPTVSTGDDAGTDPAAAAPGPASHEGSRCPVSSQAMVPPPSIDDLMA